MRCLNGCSDSESLGKNTAREQAMKHFGLFKTHNQQKPAVIAPNIPPSDEVREAFDRVLAHPV